MAPLDSPFKCLPEEVRRYCHACQPHPSYKTNPPRWPLRGRLHANSSSSSNQHEYSAPGHEPFFAQKWQEEFDGNPHIFNPQEPAARDRKSPSKNLRTTRPGQSRPFISTKDGRRDAANIDADVGIAAGVRHVEPGDTNTKAAAFQSGKLAPDFPDKVNAWRRGSQSMPAGPSGSMPAGPDVEAARSHSDRPTPDEMDLDSPTVPGSDSTGSSVRVTVEEHNSPISTSSNAAPRQQIPGRQSGPRANGFNLNDLKQAGPFAPSNTGLEDLEDITNSLPYQSRPADTLSALERTNSSRFRDLKLPQPPKIPHCPADNELNQDSWRQFGDAMTAYMHDWTRFNAAMIEHFRARQEAVTHGMYRNWVSAQGDGATAEDFEASHGSDKAGYATYMTWLKDDRKCRTWWDVAFEEHRVCLESLGDVRKKIKEMSARKG